MYVIIEYSAGLFIRLSVIIMKRFSRPAINERVYRKKEWFSITIH